MRYHTASKKEKQSILAGFCLHCGYHRKHAIRLLKSKPVKTRRQKKAGRKSKYIVKTNVDFLKTLWICTNFICGKRLKAAIPLWLPYDTQDIDLECRELLHTISSSTFDRLLKPYKQISKKIGLCMTRPGSLQKKHIPIKTNQWKEDAPGFVEADTVPHCGTSMAGQFAFSTQFVDIATGCTEICADRGKGKQGVFLALR